MEWVYRTGGNISKVPLLFRTSKHALAIPSIFKIAPPNVGNEINQQNSILNFAY